MTPPAILVVAGLRHSSVGRVAALLAQRHDALLLPELNLFMADTVGAWLLMVERSQDRLGHGLLRAIAWQQYAEESPASIAAARDWLWRRSDRTTISVLHELSQQLAPRRLAIPDLNLGWRPNYMHALSEFGRFQLLHVTRHPVLHCRELSQRLAQDYFIAPEWRDFCDNPSGVLDPQIAWYRVHRSLREQFASSPAHYLHVRLEDLLAGVEAQRGHIWAALDWPVLQHVQRAGHIESPFLYPGCEAAVGGMENEIMREPRLIQEPRRDPPLETLADWRNDDRMLSQEVRNLALELGYNNQAQV